MNIFVQNTVKELSDIPDLTACARLTINHLVLHSLLERAILTQPCYEMQLKMRGSLRSRLGGLFRCPRFRWIRSRRPSMIAADGGFSLAPRISATVSGRSARRPVPA